MSDYCGCGARPPEHPNHDCERCDWIVKVDALQRENDELRNELHRRSSDVKPALSKKKRDWLLSMVVSIQGKCAVLRHENNKLRAENDRLRLDLFGPYRDALIKAMDCVDRIFSHRDGRPDPILPDFAELGENKFEACVRLAKEYAAERDTTPVDADWLDGVMERWSEGWWVSAAPAFCVRIYQAPDQLYMNVVMSGTIKKQNPTRGDVLTALRLFGGERK